MYLLEEGEMQRFGEIHKNRMISEKILKNENELIKPNNVFHFRIFLMKC